MKHREDIWGRTQALIGRPFIYANGSLFYGEPGKHHHEILEQHPEINDLWQYPGTLAAGRVWPEQGNYWTPTGDNEEVRQALENEFSKEHSGSHQKVAIKYKYVYDQDTGRLALTKPYQYEDRHHSDLFRELGEPTGSVAAGTYNPSTGVHYMWNSDDIPKDEVERAIQKQIGSHLGASEYNVQKYVWFDGKMIVTPPQYMHDEPYHATLAQDVGYRWDDPNATIEFGYYFPDDDSLRAYHEKGQGLPAEQELKEFIRAHPKGNLETVFPKDHQASIEPEHLPEDATYPVDNLILQHAEPIAGQAAGWENQRVPFLYLPDKQYLYYGNPGDHHFGLTMKASNDHPDIWDTPHISGFLKQDGTHKIFNSMVWPNAIRPHMELLKQQLSDESVHSARSKLGDTDDGYSWNDITSFCYDPFTDRLYLSGVMQDYHYGLLERKPELMNHLDRLIWGQVHEYYKGDQSRGDVEWFSDHLNDQSAEDDYYNVKLTDSLKYKICQRLADELGWEIRDSTGEYTPQNTKQAVALFPFHKYVWADGKIAVGPRVETDSVRPWHTDLMSSMGYNYQANMPEEWNVGYYYPHDHSTYEIDSTENVPDEYSIVKQIHNHLEDGDVHAARSSAMEITRDNPWIRTKDGRYFEGVHGQSSHMQLMWDNHIDPEEVAEYGGGEMAYYWNSIVTSVYHPYECQAASYFFDTM